MCNIQSDFQNSDSVFITINTNQLKKESTKNHRDATVGAQIARDCKNLLLLLSELNQRKRLVHKELNIKGQIGETHPKDKLTYAGIIHQINEAQ